MENKITIEEAYEMIDKYNADRGYFKTLKFTPQKNGIYLCIMEGGELRELIFVIHPMSPPCWFENKEALENWYHLDDLEFPKYWKFISEPNLGYFTPEFMKT